MYKSLSPYSLLTASNTRRTVRSSHTSPATMYGTIPLHNFCVSSNLSDERAVSTSLHPLADNAIAVSRPIPKINLHNLDA